MTHIDQQTTNNKPHIVHNKQQHINKRSTDKQPTHNNRQTTNKKQQPTTHK